MDTRISVAGCWALAVSTFLALGILSLDLLSPRGAQAQSAPPAQGCVLETRGFYRCGAEPFRSRLAGARVVAVEADSMDRFTQRELRHLVERLGKQLAQPGETADLTLSVEPLDRGAISLGPADRPIASLRVYARSGQQGRGTVIWDELFYGQGDRPWPMVVRAVIDQFESHALQQNRAAAK